MEYMPANKWYDSIGWLISMIIVQMLSRNIDNESRYTGVLNQRITGTHQTKQEREERTEAKKREA
jgi:hypothetical protein